MAQVLNFIFFMKGLIKRNELWLTKLDVWLTDCAYNVCLLVIYNINLKFAYS